MHLNYMAKINFLNSVFALSLVPIAIAGSSLWPVELSVSIDLVNLLDKMTTIYTTATKSSVSHSINAKLKSYERTITAYGLPQVNNRTSVSTYKLINDSTIAGEYWTKTYTTRQAYDPVIVKTYRSDGSGDPEANFRIGENGAVPITVSNYTCEDENRQGGGITSQTSKLTIRISNKLDGNATEVKNFIGKNQELIAVCDFQGQVLPRKCERESDYLIYTASGPVIKDGSAADLKYLKTVGTTGSFRSKELNIPTGAYQDSIINSATGLSPTSLRGMVFTNFSVIDLTVRTDGYKTTAQ